MVVRFGEELAESFFERWVKQVGREFGERREDEAAQVKTRVRKREKFRGGEGIVVEQQVEVERARAATGLAPTSERVLDTQQACEHLQRGLMIFHEKQTISAMRNGWLRRA